MDLQMKLIKEEGSTKAFEITLVLGFSLERATTIKESFFANNPNVNAVVNSDNIRNVSNGVLILKMAKSPMGITIKFNFNKSTKPNKQYYGHYVDPLFLNN
jgi:hypothetical protein